nr:hypothetical protein [Baekduia soli]
MVISVGASSRRRRSGDQPADDEPDRDAARGAEQEVPHRGGQRERARDHGRHRELVGDEARGVVDEALALDDGHQAPGRARAHGDLHGRHRVGRRDDRADHERRRPGQPVDEPVGHRGDGHGRGDDEPHGQRADGPHVGAQVLQRGEERRGVQQRRQEGHQDDRGVQLEAVDAGQEGQRGAAHRQRDRVRDARALGQQQEGARTEQDAEHHEVPVHRRRP